MSAVTVRPRSQLVKKNISLACVGSLRRKSSPSCDYRRTRSPSEDLLTSERSFVEVIARVIPIATMLIRSFMLLLLVPASIAAQWGPCGAKKDEVLQMGRKIEKELPLGSTEAQVARFLDDMQLPHGKPQRDRHDPVRRYRKFRQTGATILTPARNEPAMYVQFYFDKRARLVESVVTNACGVGCYSVRRNVGGKLRDVCW